ncbi:MAG TPA: hypothetical protein VLG41_13930 [Hydrogenophaga sp.]|uniref:hypothetical protein n=1 Tax=Hydrogenophaga sp. TaxID=1904254 RepID=UPI002C41BF07|nr:hypothetical protein [Hydrogenophaga sp.]HSX94023.1 hypothetical protein [Hydrogenophaga sp.]
MHVVRIARLTAALAFAALMAACAHPIGIGPLETPVRNEAGLSARKAAYVMTDADRAREVVTPGGGGDKISYFPYRDLEKAIRDALRAVYSDVFVVSAANDAKAINELGASVVYTPSVVTTSSSPSIFTWPPTEFGIELSCAVADAAGQPLAPLKVQAKGTAEFAEFKSDFGLAGRRAASQLSEQLKQAVLARPDLR